LNKISILYRVRNYKYPIDELVDSSSSCHSLLSQQTSLSPFLVHFLKFLFSRLLGLIILIRAIL